MQSEYQGSFECHNHSYYLQNKSVSPSIPWGEQKSILGKVQNHIKYRGKRLRWKEFVVRLRN